MKWLASLLVLVLLATLLGQSGMVGVPQKSQGAKSERADPIRFVTLDLFVDSREVPLAAWQVEILPKVVKGTATLVGIEGGDHAAFRAPARYDPAALAKAEGGRVILAAFSLATAGELPLGRVRVARLHLRLEDQDGARKASAEFEVALRVAADVEGRAIERAAASAAIGDER